MDTVRNHETRKSLVKCPVLVDLRLRTTKGISVGNQLVTYISLGFVCAS